MEEIGIVIEKEKTSESRPVTSSSHSGLDNLDTEDLYTRYKKLQKQLEFLEVQEEYIKDEQRNLKKEFLHAQEEVKRIQSVPLVIGQFLEAVDQHTGIVGSTTDEKPDVCYSDIGGMDMQKQEIREAVELPLTHFDLYQQIGIDPPRGVLMYGPPGSAFIRVVGSEFVQKYLGEGPRMVRDVFRLAKENAPAIIFIDEIDAIATTKRFDAQTGADREVQRILLELLNQMDGFDQNVNLRHDTLDPALLRPGRLDRKIEFPMPDRRQKRLIFSTICTTMNLSDEVDLEDCRHASSQKNRYVILAKDFEKGYRNNIKKDESEHEFYK
ncbi:putative 26S protease regulatory subunit 6B [Apostichopus japonicus]|uniref:Putative 26S protease regulatory subunit 6B n=1 Tax=Stichopus japonicus TaxID=307972 RepID=A0A2G8LH60_STIJA|nr:putative 26S protease regulatory subunit 6B [Apostichopus japonicus]